MLSEELIGQRSAEGDQQDSMQQEIAELESLIPDIGSKVNMLVKNNTGQYIKIK